MRRLIQVALVLAMAAGAFAFPTAAVSAGGTRVGYYDMSEGQGDPDQIPPIEAAGGTAINILSLSSAELAGIDVLFAQNPSNNAWGGEYVANLENIEAWVEAGGVLIIHDRCVDGCGGEVASADVDDFLPGGDNIETVNDSGSGIDVLDPSTTVTNGPGGAIDDTTLDGGNSSHHGWVVRSTLPAGAINPLAVGGEVAETSGSESAASRAATTGSTWTAPGTAEIQPDKVVTTCYPHEAGQVIYSTIPLDFYLDGFGTNPPADAFREIYAPNVVAWGMDDCGDGGPDGKILRMFIHANGAGPGRHTARVDYTNLGSRGTGWITFAVFLPGTNPSTVQRQPIGLNANQMGTTTFRFERPYSPNSWQTRSYQIRACIEMAGDTNTTNNCVTQSFSM